MTVFPHHPQVLEAKRVSKAEDLLEKASGDKKVIKALKPKPKTGRGRPRGGGQGGNGNNKGSKTQSPGDVATPELPSAASATPSNPTAPPETDDGEKMAKWKEMDPRYVE